MRQNRKNSCALPAQFKALFVAVIWLLACICTPANSVFASTADKAGLSRPVLQAAKNGKWSTAGRMARDMRDPVMLKLVSWLYMQGDSTPDFDYIAGFIRQNPHWPGVERLRHKAEMVMPANLPPEKVVGWFVRYQPQTAPGGIKYADALMRSNGGMAVREFVRDFWVNTNLSDKELISFYNAWGGLLSQADHARRMDRLLWDNRLTQGERQMMRFLDDGQKKLVRARLALLRGDARVNALIKVVPAHLKDDPGLIYARLKWRRERGLNTRAREILTNGMPDRLVKPELWWHERHVLARRDMEEGRFAMAYALVSRHHQKDGFAFAQAEWLSGWLALRFLDRPWEAFAHFEKLYYGVETPISKARASYWGGRAAEALGQKDVADVWFAAAARQPTAFYGQLALSKLGMKPSDSLKRPLAPDRRDMAAFEGHELVRATRLLAAAGMARYVDDFLRAISAQVQTPAGHVLAARLAADVGEYKMAIRLAKNAAGDELVLFDEGYPVIDPIPTRDPDPALIHAMIRQESAFDAGAVSTAGARGLMQLMPATAKDVARRIGVQQAGLSALYDPRHNIRLGSAYLGQLLERYDGSYVLAVAAYNAGPGRVSQWIRELGDPRDKDVDMVDWIERIPVYETRNYVQRVLEGFYIYSHIMSQQ